MKITRARADGIGIFDIIRDVKRINLDILNNTISYTSLGATHVLYIHKYGIVNPVIIEIRSIVAEYIGFVRYGESYQKESWYIED